MIYHESIYPVMIEIEATGERRIVKTSADLPKGVSYTIIASRVKDSLQPQDKKEN